MEKFNEFLKMYFPAMEAPVFTCLGETNKCVKLECSSREQRNIQFSMGLIKEVGTSVYNTVVNMSTLFSFCFNKYYFSYGITV